MGFNVKTILSPFERRKDVPEENGITHATISGREERNHGKRSSGVE